MIGGSWARIGGYGEKNVGLWGGEWGNGVKFGSSLATIEASWFKIGASGVRIGALGPRSGPLRLGFVALGQRLGTLGSILRA